MRRSAKVAGTATGEEYPLSKSVKSNIEDPKPPQDQPSHYRKQHSKNNSNFFLLSGSKFKYSVPQPALLRPQSRERKTTAPLMPLRSRVKTQNDEYTRTPSTSKKDTSLTNSQLMPPRKSISFTEKKEPMSALQAYSASSSGKKRVVGTSSKNQPIELDASLRQINVNLLNYGPTNSNSRQILPTVHVSQQHREALDIMGVKSRVQNRGERAAELMSGRQQLYHSFNNTTVVQSNNIGQESFYCTPLPYSVLQQQQKPPLCCPYFQILNQLYITIRLTLQYSHYQYSSTLNTVLFQFLQPSRISTRHYGLIKAYAANTHPGLYRNYNQDRISILLNVAKDGVMNCFAVFDGHGGSVCAQFMSNHLIEAILQHQEHLSNPKAALLAGFAKMEAKFLSMARMKNPVDKSGTCALVCLIIGHQVHIANLGDSRALYINSNQEVSQITQDHKPSLESQAYRIQQSGGKIYRTKIQGAGIAEPQLGPHRVFPGRLSVSRTLGDIEAKDRSMGGIPGVVSAQPEIYSFTACPNSKLVLGCDGIYDKQSNEQIGALLNNPVVLGAGENQHVKCGHFASSIIKQSMVFDSYDNLSVITLFF